MLRRSVFFLLVLSSAAARAEVTVRDQVDGGDHWRLMTPHGAIHVWRPAGYDADVAGVVIYVHGYFTNVDETWFQHKLPDQFQAAQKNALYIVPEAPVSVDDDVKWASLGDLLRAVFDDTQVRHPAGELVVIGHSAAYRTLVPWLDYGPLNHVILLDALYGNEEDYWEWLNSAKGHAWHRLTMVGLDTARWAEPLVKRFGKDGALITQIPDKWEELKTNEQKARVLYLRSQVNHMAMITDGKVFPLVMKRAPLRDLAATTVSE
jgi:hypothetical protein